jgi:hypothetical protein
MMTTYWQSTEKRIIQRTKAKDKMNTTQTNLRNLRRIFVQFMLCFYRWLSFIRAFLFICIQTFFFSYERLSSHMKNYRRTIKFAFEYSSQFHASSSKSNNMFLNIVYDRNVNIRVTKNRFRKRSSSDNWSSKNQVLSRECWVNCFR